MKLKQLFEDEIDMSDDAAVHKAIDMLEFKQRHIIGKMQQIRRVTKATNSAAGGIDGYVLLGGAWRMLDTWKNRAFIPKYRALDREFENLSRQVNSLSTY
jgi:hypothetical protein